MSGRDPRLVAILPPPPQRMDALRSIRRTLSDSLDAGGIHDMHCRDLGRPLMIVPPLVRWLGTVSGETPDPIYIEAVISRCLRGDTAHPDRAGIGAESLARAAMLHCCGRIPEEGPATTVFAVATSPWSGVSVHVRTPSRGAKAPIAIATDEETAAWTELCPPTIRIDVSMPEQVNTLWVGLSPVQTASPTRTLTADAIGRLRAGSLLAGPRP